MTAVLMDELSGNSFFHDLLHLRGTWEWERLIGWGAAPGDCNFNTRVFEGCLGVFGQAFFLPQPLALR